MTQEEMLSYIAGFVDGEGCFSLLKSPSNDHPQAYFNLTNTDKAVLIMIKHFLESMEVHTTDIKERHRKTSWRPIFNFDVRAKDSIEKLCKLLMPRLFVKTRQCQILLSFVRIRNCQKTQCHDYLAEEFALMYAIQAINHGSEIPVERIDYEEHESMLSKE